MAKVQLDLKKINAAAGGDKSDVSLGNSLYANMAELLANRAEILTGKDRDLVMMYLEKGCSMAPLARIAGVSESTIARRIHKLMARLLNGGQKTDMDRLQDHQQAGTEVITAADMSCLMHLQGLIRRHKMPLRVMHVAEIFAGRQLA